MAEQPIRDDTSQTEGVAPCIPGLNTNQRPGWVDRSSTQGMAPIKQRVSFDMLPQETDLVIICQECYERSHFTPDYVLPLQHQQKYVQNYEQLTPAEKSSVPKTSYHCVSAILRTDGDEDKQYHSASLSPQSYPWERKYRDQIYAQWAEHHSMELTNGTTRRGDEEIQVHSETHQEN